MHIVLGIIQNLIFDVSHLTNLALDLETNSYHCQISDFSMTLPMSLPRSYTSELNSCLKSATPCGFCDTFTKAHTAVVHYSEDFVTQFVATKKRLRGFMGRVKTLRSESSEGDSL